MRPENFDDLTGRRFGRLTVIGYDVDSVDGRTRWLCSCDCGGTAHPRATHLKRGETQSCGCLQKERAAAVSKISNRKHGLHKHPLYNVWSGIMQRCFKPRTSNYHNYGGRGITVCEEWRRPEVFIAWGMANGYKKGLSIDRVDVDGNYEPSNCRWATIKQQLRNKRSNVILEVDGERKTLSEWSEISGLKSYTIRTRMRMGWSVSDAVFRPLCAPSVRRDLRAVV